MAEEESGIGYLACVLLGALAMFIIGALAFGARKLHDTARRGHTR